jgi:Cu-Zn family superoxide dismutase
MSPDHVFRSFRRSPPARLGSTLMLAISLAALAAPAAATNGKPGERSAQAKLYNTAGNQIGKVRLTQEDAHSVTIHANVHDLPPGFHGFHVHAVGTCAPPFTSAGGHLNPDQHTHRDHSGDMPVLLVNSDGTAFAKFETDRFTVAELFDSDGSAIIVHANPDNFANIPTRYVSEPDATTLATGDAGDRIACGVIEKTGEK